MDKQKEIDILNDFLNKFNITGFRYMIGENSDKITLCVPREFKNSYNDDYEYIIFGWWNSLYEMFTLNTPTQIPYLLSQISNMREIGHNIGYPNPCNYLAINDVGVDFLKYIMTCKSLKEIEIKLQLKGY